MNNKSIKLLEIIELRAVRVDRNLLDDQLKSLVGDLIKSEEIQNVKIYNRLRVESDFSIHLLRNYEKEDINGSPLGLRLTSELKEFGLVNHSVWIERQS